MIRARGLALGGVAAGVALFLGVSAPAAAQIYWANTSGTNGISRANLDGMGVIPSFVTTASPPRGVAIDSSYVYWVQGDATGTIGRGNLDGTGTPNQSFISTAASPQGIALDNLAVYWTHTVAGSGKVGRAKLDGTDINPSFVPPFAPTQGPPCGVAVDGHHFRWANGGTPGTIADAHGIFGIDQNFITGQQDPCGVAFTGSYVYWTNRAGNTIGRANLDGSGANPSFVATGMGSSPCGVAVDSGHVYWGSTGTDAIGRATLDGTTSVEPSFITGAEDPCGVAVAPTQDAQPASHDFGATAVGSPGGAQAFFVINTSSSVLDVLGADFIGANPGDFEKTGDGCAVNIAPAGGGCLINVRFSPTATGPRSATLRVTSNASNSPTDILVTGEGTPAPSPPDSAPPTASAPAPPAPASTPSSNLGAVRKKCGRKKGKARRRCIKRATAQ